jgi:TonB-dependent receptor
MFARGRKGFGTLSAAIGGAVFCVAARAADVRPFEIPAQSASSAITEFGRQSGRLIVAPGELLRGLKTPPLHGSMEVDAALAILLKSSGLTIASDDGTMVILKRQDKVLGTQNDGESETVIVNGFRASLESATNAKRSAVGFGDVVYAESIGRFPDANVAEALNRIPGITISREIDGSGVNVSVRGLGASFTKITLNDAQVAIASTGPTNQSNANREIDLNMFPVELFTQLAVFKSPQASRLEGGTAGSINMRSVRPFDNPGLHLTYSLKSVVLNSQGAFGPNAALIISDTEGPFGALLGVTTLATRFFTRGFESAGWTTPNLLTEGPTVQCVPAPRCNTLGGGNWTVPATVPANIIAAGLVPGEALDQTRLLALNPGLSITQINNMLLPRLGRPFIEKGVRSRYNGVASFEYRPSNEFHAYLDMIGGRISNNFDRADINWMVRNGAAIPTGVTVDANNVVMGGTFANAQWLLEARPYHEYGDFISVNPGLEWRPSEKLEISFQANVSRSHFLRDSPTILVDTAPNAGYPTGVTGPQPVAGGIIVTYANRGASIPSLVTNVDLNDPANFTWVGGRVNINAEKRYTTTNGLHLDGVFGDNEFNVRAGLSYDQAYRSIIGYDNSQDWQNAVCGNGPNVFVPAPNTQPPCQGLNVAGNAADVAGAAAGYPAWPGLGTGYSASAPALTYRGSLIPQSRLSSYLHAGPAGFVLVDYDAFFRDSHYRDYAYPNAPAVGNTNLAVGSGSIDEKNYGLYGEINGVLPVLGHSLNYNAGLRWVVTLQTVSGPVSSADPRNGELLDGGRYPNTAPFSTAKRVYEALLPSANVRYALTDDLNLRAAASRTMTRPNPSVMLPGLNFSDPSAAAAQLGNSMLRPYFSNNVDLGAEYFTSGEGMIGISTFYKSVTGFTVQSTTTQPFSYLAELGVTYTTLSPTQQTALNARGGPNAAMVQVSAVTNSERALAITGFEFTLVQPLDAILSRYGLTGFGFTANLTAVRQSGGAPTLATGVAPYTYNLMAYYESDTVSLHMSYVFNGAAPFTEPNQNGVCLPNIASRICPDGARIYNADYGQLDLSANLKLSVLFGSLPTDPALMLDIQNLTQSKLRSYFQYSSATYAAYVPGTTIMFGIRGTI